MKLILIISLFFIYSMNAFSEIISSEIEYKVGDLTLQGFIAYDNSSVEKRPGVLIVHQWKGLTDYEKSRAVQIAELGYFAFAVDIYGKGVRPATSEEASQVAGQFYADIQLYRERLNAGLNELKMQPMVNPDKIAAIGYCFGGGGVLELARSGADILGVITFHGSLKSQNPDDAKNIKGRVLVQHGAIDPFVKEEDIIAFKKEMEDANVDYVLTEYAGAVHSFTQKSAGNDVTKGSAYNEKADKRSWEAMKIFLKEIFGT